MKVRSQVFNHLSLSPLERACCRKQGPGCGQSSQLPFPGFCPLHPKVHRRCQGLVCMTSTPLVDLSGKGESEMEYSSHNRGCPLSSAMLQPHPMPASTCWGHLPSEMAVEWRALFLQKIFLPQEVFFKGHESSFERHKSFFEEGNHHDVIFLGRISLQWLELPWWFSLLFGIKGPASLLECLILKRIPCVYTKTQDLCGKQLIPQMLCCYADPDSLRREHLWELGEKSVTSP